MKIVDYCTNCGSRKLQYVPPSLGEELDLLHRVFIMYDNDKKKKLTLDEVIGLYRVVAILCLPSFQAELALRSLHIEGASLQQLLTAEQQSPHSFPCTSAESTGQALLQQYRKHGLTFDEFCSVYAELKFILLKSSGDAGSLLSAYLSTPLKWIASKYSLQSHLHPSKVCPLTTFQVGSGQYL